MQAVSNSLWAYAKLGYNPGILLLDVASQKAAGMLHQYTSQELAKVNQQIVDERNNAEFSCHPNSPQDGAILPSGQLVSVALGHLPQQSACREGKLWLSQFRGHIAACLSLYMLMQSFSSNL